MLAQFATKRDPRSEEDTNDRRAVGELPDERSVVKSHLPKTDAMGAIRTNVPNPEPIAAFGGGESQLGRGGEHGQRSENV